MIERGTEGGGLSLLVENVRDTLALNLSAARGALGMSQEQLANAARVSRATVNQLEGGSSANGDPRLSTVVSLAAALGISPVFLLLGRDELGAIAEAAKSADVKGVHARLTAEELETMGRLLRSGVPKNRAKAVEMGATAAASAGMTAGAIATAAIGTAQIPGIGTALGAVMGKWLGNVMSIEKKGDAGDE